MTDQDGRTVLAAVEDVDTAPTTLRAARTMGRLLGARVECLHVGSRLPDGLATACAAAQVEVDVVQGPVARTVVEALRADHVVLGVLAPRVGGPPSTPPLGHVAETVVAATSTPLLLVGPDVDPDTIAAPRRALVPLDGRQAVAEAVADVVAQLRDAGVAIVVQHVVVAGTPVPFVDQPQHGLASWEHEFLARGTDVADELVLDRGRPRDRVLEAIGKGGVDLVVLGWRQQLAEGRAEVVRGLLQHGDVPVLLVPVADTGPLVRSWPAPR